MKKIFTLFLFLLVGTNSVAYAGNAASPDAVDFARTVAQTIADMGDNPDVGNRSSGSPAEKQAAAFIEQTMKDIGLQNVTVDPITVDNWTFNRGRVYYTDADGEQQFFSLGGFATNLTCDMQEVSVVYAGRGTAEEYEGLDAEGKVVLFDIDQAKDWWVEIPAYEAHVHGALCSLVCNVSGHAYYDADTIGSQDYCGPDDVPAFSLSQNSAAILRRLAEENGGEAKVITALEDCLTSVDYNWYAYSFSQETYDYMLDKMFNKAVGTWGEDMIRFDGENLWTLMHGLMEKTEDDDFAVEISELEAALARQQENRTALDEQMAGDIAQFTERILSVAEG